MNPVALTFAGTLGEVRGLAASATRIFVSDYANGLVRIVDASTLMEISEFALPHCGPIAYDGTNFWITQCATHDTWPLTWHVTGTDTPSIRCYSPTGADLSSTHAPITDVAIPTAIAYDDQGTPGTTSDDRLLVCDNGPHQYVHCYTNLTGNPVAGTPFGQDAGIWAGSHPGQITDSASGGDKRFYGPTGVGVDSSHNIYVACNGGSYFVTDLRKFDTTGTLVWRQNGLVFVQAGDFDPSSDGQDIYMPEKHFAMNYANTAPGSEWTYKGFTRDIRQNANEARTPGAPASINCAGVKLARLGSGSKLYMYTSGQGSVGISWLYYFNGETAMPYGTNGGNGTAPNYHQLWIDTNMNGVVDVGETTSAPLGASSGNFQSFDVDSKGDIWMNNTGSIRRIIYQGTRTLTNGAVVPNYSLNAGGYADYFPPAPITTAWNISYDAANDILYAVGQTSAGAWKLARCDKWEANPENQLNPVATWTVDVPAPPDITIFLPLPALIQYMGMDIAGGKIFVAELYGPAHVYDAATGNMEFTLNPGPQLSARMGWVDMSMGINAYKRSTGEYLILEDNTGFNACDILYRWTPTADTAVTAAPTALMATAPGRKVVLSWNGPVGMVTSYKLYRGTSSGSETLYQSGITGPTFTDLNVTPGTTYYYKVTAINAAGESAQSNEASAMPLSSAAEFVKTDTTTQGTWKGVYGTEGYEICNNTINYPGYVSGVTYTTWTDPAVYPVPPNPVIPVTLGTWANPSTDVRALQKPDPATDRVAAYRGAGGTAWPFSFNFAFTDATKWHQVAVYIVDWTNTRPVGISVQIVDTATGVVLDTRWLGNHQNGKYLVWNVIGNVQVKIVQHPYTDETVASGIFFDPVQVKAPAVAWWKFDETSGATAADSSGAGHNATASGTTWDPSGKINRCIKIPGGTARVNLPTSLIAGRVPITLSAWFKTSSTTGAAIAGYANSSSSPSIYVPALYVGIDGKLRGTFYTGSTSSSTVLASTTTVNNGAWHHAALVGNAGIQTLYLDGNIVDYHSGTILTTSLPYNYLGYANVSGWPSMTGTTNNFNGWLDDVRIYDKVLTPGQVYQLANP